MNKPVGGNVNVRQKVAIHKKVPLLICPTTVSDTGAHQQNKPGDLSLYRSNAKHVVERQAALRHVATSPNLCNAVILPSVLT